MHHFFKKDKPARVVVISIEDSLLFIRHREAKRNHNDLWVGDLAPTILKMMHLPIPAQKPFRADMDGVALV